MLRAHPDVIAALAKRGITDMDMVFMDTWTYGDAVAPPEYRDRRLGWSDTWVKNEAGANPYANRVSGLHCVIDVNTMELLRIEDNGGVDPAERDGRVRAQAHSRAHPRDLATASRSSRCDITQPEGPSFTVDGNLVQWQNWSLRVGFNHREGMTLHQIRYRDGDREPLDRAPDLVRRDDGAVPRLVRGPLPAHRVRHRRVGPRLHDDVAGAGLRLPRRDPLPRRGAAQQQGRAVHDPQRGLHPRGGQRRAVEARRPRRRGRGAPDAPADGVLPRDRRQLRVPRLLAASTRTATSSARSAPPASW